MKKFILISLVTLLICLANSSVWANTGTVSPGDTVNGTLEEWDGKLADDCYYDSWTISCEKGELLTVIESSGKIDPYLIIYSPDGESQWTNDDYSYETMPDARIDVPINISGEYEIVCTSYEPQTGTYELTVDLRQKPRYFGIFIGMDDYGWAYENAPKCDEDAHYMYRTFIDAGLMDPKDGIELLNHRSRRIDLENAFNEIRSKIGPDDIFIFFFSGHGDRVPVSTRDSGVDIDGYDEVISLRDVDLPDNDLRSMLDGLGAGLTMVVIDSCHSGGFAADLRSLPNTVFYGASEEDVVSAFAEELGAGGYLSLFFREAIDGDADLDGDGVLLIGELTHFLKQRLYEEWEVPDNSMWGFQELVSERGTVGQDEIFCWFVE